MRNPFRRLWGVRFAAAVSAGLAVALALTIAGVALVVLQTRGARAGVEKQARTVAAQVAERLKAGDDISSALRVGSAGPALLQILDQSGRVVGTSSQFADDRPFSRDDDDRLGRAARNGGTFEDDDQLVVAQPVETPGGRLTVIAASSLAVVEQSASVLGGLVAVGIPILALLAGLTTYMFTRRALGPVDAIRAQVAAMSERDLNLRVPEPATRDEVGELARTMNALLARLQAGQTAQRQFVADASHELRSPLATISARIDLALLHGPTRNDVLAMAPEAARMARLVDDLLLLARADERGLTPRRDDVDIDDLAESEARQRRDIGAARVLVRTVPVRVSGDRAQLARLLRNLLDNAVRHASSEVAVHVRVDDDEAVLEVSDDGPGVPIADRRRVFERFVRLDEARARSDGGAGLGLAIVAEVAAAHGGNAEVSDSLSGGALFRIRLPAQPMPDAASSRMR